MYHTRHCAKHLHCELWVGGVCFPRPGRFALCSWQLTEGLDGLTPALPSCPQRAHEPRAAQRGGEALECVSTGTARLAPAPEPSGWQGLSPVLAGGRGAGARAEMGA